MNISQQNFGEFNGESITSYTMVNDKGMEVTCLNYGCIVTKIMAPDRAGKLENVILGFDSIREYQNYSPYFGAVVGRFAGRIKNAEFHLNGKQYKLAKNDSDNHLHGGLQGFDKAFWKAATVKNKDSVALEFTYLSKDGEEGYPGNLSMTVTYTLNNQNEFILTYSGESDQCTLVNITNNSYFNLSGDLKRDILNHRLTLKSEQCVELDHNLIPTGELFSVEGTSFDFRAGRKIVDGTTSENPQNILAGKGYDHPLLLTENNNKEIILEDEESGRVMAVETNQPALVLYTGNQLENHFTIRGVPSRKYLGLCLETQGLPDSIHHSNFPQSILEKGERYHSETKFTFGILKD